MCVYNMYSISVSPFTSPVISILSSLYPTSLPKHNTTQLYSATSERKKVLSQPQPSSQSSQIKPLPHNLLAQPPQPLRRNGVTRVRGRVPHLAVAEVDVLRIIKRRIQSSNQRRRTALVLILPEVTRVLDGLVAGGVEVAGEVGPDGYFHVSGWVWLGLVRFGSPPYNPGEDKK